ncbi:helix-turn-helix domain-containing protein [Pseudovibrio exalbescens]|uniref:helix-turn-helix domain-containing protein n=1 Tax=Pseudovibrio exalbescens TaxID=197461 RepID=UPI0003F62C13|nr:helix-turn-helix domain-containing protein [Pseudovibrio exalbescens]
MSEQSQAWSWRQAIYKSNLPAMTKHVLQTLSAFMNSFGESCYPSVETLAEYTSLSKRAVIDHLRQAREAGWIEVSSHGFRGQKWKRNEYTPRWPDRDLVASCGVINDERGGEGGSPPRGKNARGKEAEGGEGELPPPSKKVVKEVHEGGYRDAPKVVTEVHQDKNSPDNIPIPVQIERERARENPEQVEGADTATVTPETWKRRLKRVHAQWPTFTSDSDAAAEKAWFDLSAEERQAACDLAGAYIEQCKAEGRKKFCSFAVYLSEKRWLKVNAKAGLATAGEVARPFGKAWGAARFADLMREPYGVFPKPTGFIAAILERGGPDAERERAQRVARYGWPRVNTMQERAVRSRASITVDGALAPLADMFEPVKVGGEVWQAWRLLHEEHNWPWFGAERDLPEWVYMPARPMDEPGDELAAVRAALASFEAAYRETFSGQEAAE